MVKLEFDENKFDYEINLLLSRGVNYLDAVIVWCRKNNIELELIASIIKKNVINKNRLMLDASSRSLLKKNV